MAPRTYAKISLARWNDDDWTGLSMAAMGLYDALLTDPLITLAGVVDWRPNRIAKRFGGANADIVRAVAAELQDGERRDGKGLTRFIVVDEETEEVLVRSFVRHDGLLKSPNMTVSMCNAHGAIASPIIREWVVWEAWRGVREEPDCKGAPVVRERFPEPDRNPSEPVPISFDPGSVAVPFGFPLRSA